MKVLKFALLILAGFNIQKNKTNSLQFQHHLQGVKAFPRNKLEISGKIATESKKIVVLKKKNLDHLNGLRKQKKNL